MSAGESGQYRDRFTQNASELTNWINNSLGFDSRLYREDIEGSIAHAKMLGKQGIILRSDADAIVRELECMLNEDEPDLSGTNAEDIHSATEYLLTAKLPEAGKRLHTARSRNDQVALDFKLYLKKQCAEVQALLIDLLKVLAELAEKNTDAIMPAFTHLQHAQPTTFAHYMMAYAQMLRRDRGRLGDCAERMDECPLGAGALCGTTYPIDREFVAAELGFTRITENSLDAVSDRDFAVEFLSALSIIQMHLSRFSEEIIVWSTQEFEFIELSDRHATTSSMMPQKKNPDTAELIRGKTGRVYGSLTTLLTVMKGLSLAYNKDMQEDKEAVFDALDTVKLSLRVFAQMLGELTVKRENMLAAARKGFMNATDCADYLVGRGVPFREAHEIVGRLVRYCVDKNTPLEALTLEEFREFSDKFGEDVYDIISLEACVERRNVPGGPAKMQVERQIESVKRFIAEQ